jgi:hypothetical protein
MSSSEVFIREGAEPLLGNDSFRLMVETKCTFVDKTLFIEEFISAPDVVSLILRPMLFGKSTNLDMLRSLHSTLYLMHICYNLT